MQTAVGWGGKETGGLIQDREKGGGGRKGGVLAIETIYQLSFDHAVENHETDGEDTEIWFNLNMWIVRGEILAGKWNII